MRPHKCVRVQSRLQTQMTTNTYYIMKTIFYGIKHIEKGYLVRTQDNRVEYRERDYSHAMWLGSHEEAVAKLNEQGRRLHDLVCIVR